VDWVILLSIIAVAAWWIYRKETPAKLAPLVMSKWIETAQTGAAAAEAGNGAALIGQSVTVSDFRYEFGGVPPMLKVSVFGTGAYLGFRGDIANDGNGWVWVEEGCRPGAKKLLRALCSAYPDLINGNKFSSHMRKLVERFADSNVPVRLPPNPPQAPQPTPQADTRRSERTEVPSVAQPAGPSIEPNTPTVPPDASEPDFLSREWFRVFNNELLGGIIVVLILLLLRFGPQMLQQVSP
jgi:hypothetical protein